MQFRNESKQTVLVAIGLRHPRVKPGETVEIEDGYACARRYDNGSRRPSVIEEIAPQLKPADADERRVWEQAPEVSAQAPRLRSGQLPTVEGMVAAGIPLGQAELIYKQALRAALDAVEGRSEAELEALTAPDAKSKAKPKAAAQDAS